MRGAGSGAFLISIGFGLLADMPTQMRRQVRSGPKHAKEASPTTSNRARELEPQAGTKNTREASPKTSNRPRELEPQAGTKNTSYTCQSASVYSKHLTKHLCACAHIHTSTDSNTHMLLLPLETSRKRMIHCRIINPTRRRMTQCRTFATKSSS